MEEIMIPQVNRVFSCDVKKKSRLRTHVFGRIAISNYLRYNSKMTLMEIGNLIEKDHVMIIYYLKTHIQLYKYDLDYRLKYDRLKEPIINKRWICNQCTYPFKIIN